MNSATPKKREWPVIRVFVSSTFTDFKHERDALHKNVFRKLELHCGARGFQFQAIDLRWGVPMEAALDHRTMQICFEELRRSQQISPQPNFLILLGNRYGWRPLPEVISAGEFGRLLTTATDNHNDYRGRSATDILRQWYVQDENSRPAETAPGFGDYLLMSRLTRFNGDARDYGKTHPNEGAPPEDTPEWKNVETALWDLVNATYKANDLIGRFGGLNGSAADDFPQIVRFQASATEQEIWRGAFCVEHAHEHVLAFIREIDGGIDHPAPAQIRSFIDVKPGGQIDTDARDTLEELKKELRDRLRNGNVISSGGVRLGEVLNEKGELIFDISQGHLASMCQQVEAQLKTIIDRQMDEFLGPQHATVAERARRGLQQEQREHERFGEERARADLFVGREVELRRIDAYLSNNPGEAPPDFRQPLIITGASGSGKTTLLSRACAIARAKETFEDRQPILRLLGISPHSSDVRGLLRGLCQELRVRDPRDGDIPQDINLLNKELRDHFESATAVKPVHIFLDALDQLSDADNGRALHWLRRDPLPEHVKLVVSCLSDCAGKPGGEPLSALEARKVPETNFVRLDALSEGEANTLFFKKFLRDAQRWVTDTQRQTIESRLKAPECRQPLYLKILFEEARLWRSFDKGGDLGGNVSKLLQALFDRLSASTNHGPTVEFAMGYLASARRGLTEIEILEILHREREYADSAYGRFLENMTRQTGHRLPDDPKRIPIAIWSRLRFDLAPYLTEHAAPGGTVLNFYHRNLLEAVRERYLPSKKQQRQAHGRLAEYFDAQDHWLESLEDQQRRAKTLPPTPRPANVRKVDELPWQFLQAADWQKSEQLLTDLAFLEAKAEAGMVFEVAGDFGEANGAIPADRPLLRILRLLEEAIRRDIHFVARHPTTLFQCLWNICWWYDCPQAVAHYDLSTRTGKGPLPWEADRRPLSTLLEQWRGKKERSEPDFTWLRSLRPPPLHLGTAQKLVLQGHTNAVLSVCFSHDGRRLASASWDQTVRVWDARSGAELLQLQGHTHAVLSVCFSPDGQRLASASEDHTVRMWDATSGAEMLQLQGHTSPVFSVCFSPDGRRLASASRDWTVRVWDATSGAEIFQLQGHTHAVFSVCFSPDGRRLASASGDLMLRAGKSSDNTVRMWDATSGAEVLQFQGHPRAVTSVCFSPNGQRLASASGDFMLRAGETSDNTIRVWDASSGAEVLKLQGHTNGVECVCFSPDGRRLASASQDHTIRMWDASSGAEVLQLQGHTSAVLSVCFSPDGQRLASASDDNTVRVWDASGATDVLKLQGHTKGVTDLCFSPDGKQLASASSDNMVRVWNASSGAAVLQLKGHTKPVYTVCHHGQRLGSASEDHTVRVWDTSNGACLQVIEWTETAPDLRALAAGPANASWRAFVRGLDTVLEDAATGLAVATFPATPAEDQNWGAERYVFTSSPTGRTWAWHVDQYIYLVTLEGPPARSLAARGVT